MPSMYLQLVDELMYEEDKFEMGNVFLIYLIIQYPQKSALELVLGEHETCEKFQKWNN